MSIVSHVVTTTPQSATRMDARYEFTDSAGGVTVVEKLVPIGFDVEADALSMYAGIEQQLADTELQEAMGLAEHESNPDKVAQHQLQADFDRRLLARLMMVKNVHTFYAGYDFFQAMEGRGGANKVSRSDYLGVPLAEYDLVDKRFGDVKGIEFFINDEKDRVWEDPLEGWE